MSFSRTFIYEAIDNISPKLAKIANNMDKVSNKTKTMGKNIQNVGRGMFRNFTLPVSAGLAAVIFQGGKFEDALASLEAITGVTGESLNKLGKDIRSTAQTFNLDAANIAKGMEFIGSKQPELVKTPNILLDVAKSAAILSKAAGQDFSESAGDLMDILNAFGINGKKAYEVINVMAASAKYGSVAIPFVSRAMVQSGAVSEMLKVRYEDTTAALQVLGAKGFEASQTGRIFANSLLRLERQTNRRYKPSVVGLSKAIENLSKSKMSTVRLTKIIGEENIKLFPTLLKNRKQFEDLRKKIIGTNVANEQAAIKMRTVNERLSRLWVTIKNKLIDVFDKLKPTLVIIIDGFVKVVNIVSKFAKNNPVLAKTIFVIVGALAALAPILITIGTLITLLGSVFSPVILIIGGIVVALAGVGYAIYKLYDKWDVVVGWMKKGVQLIKDSWASLKEFFVNLWDGIINTFKSAYSKIEKYSPSNIYEGAKDFFGLGKVSGTEIAGLPPAVAERLKAAREAGRLKHELNVKFESKQAKVTGVDSKLEGTGLLGLNFLGL